MSAQDETWSLPTQQSLPRLLEARLVSALRSGELKAGERIVETTLAKRFNVSRGPLREALKSLEANQLVVTRHGKGTFVADVSRDDLVRMSGVRAVLEGFAARLVADRCRHEPQVVQTLAASLAKLEDAVSKGAARLRAVDWEFHELVCTLSNNAFLYSTWHSISSLVRLFQQSSELYDEQGESIVSHHQEFHEALCSGDPDRAEATFRRIILTSAFGSLAEPVPDAIRSMLDPARA